MQYKKIKIYTDGGARGNPGPAGAGWVLVLDETLIIKGNKFLGIKTNNQAEYAALQYALESLEDLSYESLEIYMDSELIVKQLLGEYRVKNAGLLPYYQTISALLDFKNWSIHHIPREQNKKADFLANQAMDMGK
jgi:ribonuclease HI